MMELILANPHHLISTEQFMERIWGQDSDAEIHVVWVYISYLRKKLAAFPLSDVVNETALSFQALALTKDKSLETNVESMISMIGNEKQLRQLVSILLDNAMKYSDLHGRIRLELKKQPRSIRLTVENTTDGIQKETLDNMFERFYRGDPSHGPLSLEPHPVRDNDSSKAIAIAMHRLRVPLVKRILSPQLPA